VVFRERAHLLTSFFRSKVVFVALAASVNEGLTLQQGTAVRPPWLICLTGALQAGELTGARQLWTAALHATIICLKHLPELLAVIALAVCEREAVVGLGLIIPADFFLLASTILCAIRGLHTFFRQAVGQVFGPRGLEDICRQHSEGVVGLH